VILNLKAPEGQRILAKLLAKADVVLHNLRSGAERLGYAYEQVRAVNPNVVYVCAGSYGSTGPGAGRPAFGPIAAAVSGATMWSIGRGNEPPNSDVQLETDDIVKHGLTLYKNFGGAGSPDLIGGSAVASAIAMGLYVRERTGKGQYMETSMIMSNSYLCSDDFLRYEGKSARQLPDRDLRGLHALHRLYRAGGNSWVFLTAQGQREFDKLCRAIGREDLLQDARYWTPAARVANDELLIATLALTFLERTADEWEAALLAQDVACVRADRQSYAEFFLTDPSVKENGFIVQVEHPTFGKRWRNGPGVKLSETPGEARPSRPFGGDTPGVLAELGISAAEIEELRQKGVVKWEETAGAAVGAG
jgi:crotonobetainyl-CoA:carnitine CoA-transferase CaiB-like acyl-CoA transferase